MDGDEPVFIGELPVLWEDRMAMQLVELRLRFFVSGPWVFPLNPSGREQAARVADIDFTQDFVRIGPALIDSDVLRWALERVDR